MSAGHGTTYRSVKIAGLKKLKCPSKKGTKKEYDDFLENIKNHVSVAWYDGADTSYFIKKGKHMDLPKIEEPDTTGVSDEKEKRLWDSYDKKVARQEQRQEAREENTPAAYSLIHMNLSATTKSKLRSVQGHEEAHLMQDLSWLMEKLDDIMIEFEKVKSSCLALDDQAEKILKLRQTGEENEDFIKLFTKEVKVYEKHGGSFLWGDHVEKSYKKDVEVAKLTFKIENEDKEMSEKEIEAVKKVTKEKYKERIMAMAIMKRADKKRYGAMKIKKNRQKSSGKRTKHMDNRYFWIKDRLESEKIQVEYCPTAKMVADFFTKPLQGSLFRKLRDVVMGYTHISSLDQEPEGLTAQESVGKDESVSQPSGAAKRMTYVDVAKRNLKQ